MPFLAVLYLLGYIDRANIGNAKIEGMVSQLHMDGVQYNIAVSLFFVTYILFGMCLLEELLFDHVAKPHAELPSNAVLAHVKRPSRYVGVITIAWGIVMTLTGLVQNFGGLVATRVMLGFAE